jgi:hypothetical protein
MGIDVDDEGHGDTSLEDGRADFLSERLLSAALAAILGARPWPIYGGGGECTIS